MNCFVYEGLLPRMTHVMNTHSHSDHHLRNIAFAESTVIGSKRCREWVYLVESLAVRSCPNTEPVSAGTVSPTFSKTSVMLEGADLMFWALSGAHTNADLMISLPDDTV